MIFYNNKRSKDGSIVHSGDNTTGEGAGDDETIICNLNKVSPHIDSIWPIITIYTNGK